MFGRLRIKRCRLDEASSLAYRSNFCSVCHTLRQHDGRTASFLTNYDSTFWLVLADGLSKTPSRVSSKPCTAVPLIRVDVAEHDQVVSQANTAILWLLAEAKAVDDLEDEQSLKARLFLKLSSAAIGRARQLLEASGFPVREIEALPQRQKSAESVEQPRLRDVAEPSQRALEAIFVHLSRVCERPELRSSLAQFGRELGLVIYLLDAYEDRETDLAAGRFNALAYCHDAGLNAALEALDRMEYLTEELGLRGPSLNICTEVLAQLRRKTRPLPRTARRPHLLRRAGFFLNPFERNRCCKYCECNPCDACEGCCEGINCCSSCSDCGDGCGCDGCGCDGCDGCDCSGCDCGGCDCGCAC